MGVSRQKKALIEQSNAPPHPSQKPALGSVRHADPDLVKLFASSSGPVKAPASSRYEADPLARVKAAPKDGLMNDDEELSELEDELDSDANVLSDFDEANGSEHSSEGVVTPVATDSIEHGGRTKNLSESSSAAGWTSRRKRKRDDDNLESRHFAKLARDDAREMQSDDKKSKKRRLQTHDDAEEAPDMGEDEDKNLVDDSAEKSNVAHDTEASSTIIHESLLPAEEDTDVEKAGRTVFLANVCTSCITSKSAKKALSTHLTSFFDELEILADKAPPRLESLRFRSTAFSDGRLPKKAAFVKKELMAATTKSTNAYAVYSTPYAAREAVKRLNGTIVLDRHLRVDGVAHPARIDHRRCVFVGNLGFVDDESSMMEDGEHARKRGKVPADIEEGLWRQFGKAGKVESVRVVRDEKTRVGKGFAYVQFEDANAVEAALLFNEKKYPPMLPRILRVVRAKAKHKTALASQVSRTSRPAQAPPRGQVYNPKPDLQKSTLQGRASKLLGRAGAARVSRSTDPRTGQQRSSSSSGGGRRDVPSSGGDGRGSNINIPDIKPPESFVFEGYRATAANGRPRDLKFGKTRKKRPVPAGRKGGRPGGRSAKRGAEWKKTGGARAGEGK